jgi:hypothetical protein
MPVGMEDDSGDETAKWASWSTACLGCTWLIGFISMGISIAGLSSEPVWIVDRLLKFNLAHDAGSGFIMTTRICMVVLLVSSLVLLLAMTLGIIGAICRSKLLVAIGSTVAFLYSIHMLGSGVFMLTRYEMVVPTIDRQVDFLCNTTTYERLSANMKCPWVNSEAIPQCMEACQDRVSTLLTLNGCELLPKLCERSSIADDWWATAVRLSLACIVTAALLICTTTASCCLMYSINFSRRGKPTAKNLCCILMCPCCPGDSGKGFTDMDFESEDGSDLEY